MELTWKIGGEAGLGVMTIGEDVCKALSRYGLYVFSYSEYPSLIRGGHNTVEISTRMSPIYAPLENVDILICLNSETYHLHKHRLHNASIVIYDPADFTPHEGSYVKIALPFTALCKRQKAFGFGKNAIAFGATVALLGGEFFLVERMNSEKFAHKGEKVIALNNTLARSGFDLINSNYSAHIRPILNGEKKQREHMVVSGNDTFSLASVASDMRFYAAYPMTPSSSILATLAALQEKTGIVVRHAEDEISVILTALGASWAGVRSAVGTSGGGFALMVEAISLAGVAEMPLVIYLGMRPGPATGMPTWTEQGDLLFAAHAGHGEFPKIVLAPGTMEEMAELTAKAYNLADIYQTPVIIVADKFLTESYATLSKEAFKKALEKHPVNRGKFITEWPKDKPYTRYRWEEDGISPWLIPGVKGQFYQSNSYSHKEDGHTTEDGQERKRQVDKTLKKQSTYLHTHFEPPQYVGSGNEDTVLVTWGGTKGIVLEAQEQLKRKGKEIGILHFTHVYPLQEEKVKQCFKDQTRYILVENNATAQFGQLLRMQTGITLRDAILRYDGRPISITDITRAL